MIKEKGMEGYAKLSEKKDNRFAREGRYYIGIVGLLFLRRPKELLYSLTMHKLLIIASLVSLYFFPGFRD